MSKGNTFENDFLKLVFNGTAIANIADNAASGPLASLYLSFHTADPGEGGSQTTSECAYGNYARKAITRDSSGFTVTANTVNPTADVSGNAANASTTELITHFAIGTALSGAGKILFSGTLTPNVQMANGVTPILTTATAITED